MKKTPGCQKRSPTMREYWIGRKKFRCSGIPGSFRLVLSNLPNLSILKKLLSSGTALPDVSETAPLRWLCLFHPSLYGRNLFSSYRTSERTEKLPSRLLLTTFPVRLGTSGRSGKLETIRVLTFVLAACTSKLVYSNWNRIYSLASWNFFAPFPPCAFVYALPSPNTLLLLLLFVTVVFETLFLYSFRTYPGTNFYRWGWPWTHRSLPASFCQVLGLKHAPATHDSGYPFLNLCFHLQ